MKKTVILFIAFISLTACKSINIFNSGQVISSKPVEQIELNYFHDLPLVKVEINGKEYTFLFDTGAPTVISTEVYNELGLKPSYKRGVSDSQRNRNEQIFTILPEMKIGNLKYEDIGCVVLDLKDFEFKCIGIDGIVGANQMAFSFWRIDYLNGFAETTPDLSNFDLSDYDYTFSFFTRPQRTPLIEFNLFNQKRNMTFDTGYSGRFKMSANDVLLNEIANNEKKYRISGITSVGAYGTGNSSEEYCFKTNEISLGGVNFSDEIIETGKSTLLGNEFLKDFVFVLDWKNNKIYLKRVKDKEKQIKSFGFGSRYINGNLEVIMVLDKENNPVQIGDIILKMNDKSFENLTDEEQCENYRKKTEKEVDILDVTLKRGDSIHNLTLEKKIYLE